MSLSSIVLFYINRLIYLFFFLVLVMSISRMLPFPASVIDLTTAPPPPPGYGSGSTSHLFGLIAGFPDHRSSTGCTPCDYAVLHDYMWKTFPDKHPFFPSLTLSVSYLPPSHSFLFLSCSL